MPYQQPRTPIGRRRHKIAIQQSVTAEDGMGGRQVLRWQAIAEPWAAITPLDERTKEALAAQQITSRHAYHVDIRYRADITPQMRVQWGEKILEIHSITDDEAKGRRLILQCGEVQ